MRRPLNYLTASMLVVVLHLVSCAVIPPTLRMAVNFRAKNLQGTPEEVAKAENRKIAGPEGQIPLRFIHLTVAVLFQFLYSCMVAVGSLEVWTVPTKSFQEFGCDA